MATATANAADAGAPKGKGKKKLIIIVVAALVLLGGGGAAALMLMKKKPADADGEEGAPAHVEVAQAKPAPGTPPTYVPLDPFTVNLADKDTERYAQIGVTLEVSDPKFAEQMKAYMPSIRNNILLILAHKNSEELHELSGKQKLAAEIARASVLPMGIEIEEEDESEADDAPPKEGAKKRKKRRSGPVNPVTNVHFSTFIIQ